MRTSRGDIKISFSSKFSKIRGGGFRTIRGVKYFRRLIIYAQPTAKLYTNTNASKIENAHTEHSSHHTCYILHIYVCVHPLLQYQSRATRVFLFKSRFFCAFFLFSSPAIASPCCSSLLECLLADCPLLLLLFSISMALSHPPVTASERVRTPTSM